ncbi:class B sortase [Clostridioides difficile]|uniref:class B sortase n=1 Tax=Clostridioides difficile TaxID=1496 RepID=UPI001266A473|nr:class B sortase [Clostridioides difficile]MDL5120591.1 class B sortase [Clostridioides difficile]QFS33390.1 class B sortase [Clostridioides difficile]QIF80159.1 class B sortase [Clostridioides difficile]
MNKFRKIINVVLVIALVISFYKIVIKVGDYIKAYKVYEEVKDIKENIEKENKNIIDLSNINKDYRGWITIKNTNIDYPIVQSENNSYYLNKDINKNYLPSGSIFLDFRNQMFNDKNTVIYGHYMKDKTMFGQLKNYKNEDFFNKNKIISISTPKGNNLKYEIFSVYVTDSKDEYIKTSFENDFEYEYFLNNITNKSIFKPNINITAKDKILTLSTCSYEFKNARMVVHAKLLN